LGVLEGFVSAQNYEVVMAQETTALLIKDLRNARRLLGPDWNKRIAAAQQLGALHAVEAIGDLAAVIGEKKNADLCQACVQAVGQIGGPQAVQALAQVFDDPDQATLHAQAIAALQQIGDEAAVTALIAGWAQPDPARQQAIVQALTELGPERIFGPLLLACAGSTPLVSEQAGKMLRQLPDSTARLVAALGNPEPGLRSKAGQLLAQMGLVAVPALIVTLGQADENARGAAVSVLSKIGAPAVPALVKTLTGADATMSKTAGLALVSIGQPAARPLLELLPTQPAVADLLAQMKPAVKAALDKTSSGDLSLVKAAFELSDADLRTSAGLALARIGKPAMPYLVQALHGDDDGRAQAAATALGQMGEPAVGELIKGLLSDNEETSRLAAGGLANAGEPAVQALLELLGQPSERDRSRALDLLHRIEAPEAVMLRPFLAHWKEMEDCPRVLTIDPTGKGDFANLADAVAGAAPVSIIFFAVGQHRLQSQLFINEPIALLGIDTEKTRLLCDDKLILVGDGPVLLRNLSIEYTGASENDVLWIKTTEARVDSCRFTGAKASGLRGRGFGGNGLRLYGGTHCIVTKCEFDHNELGAIRIDEYAQSVIEDNQCQGGSYALAFVGLAAGTARRNRCTTRQGYGIGVFEGAHPQLANNDCEKNEIGIVYEGSSQGSAYSNRCTNNSGWGIAVKGEASPTLESNVCTGNAEFGIGVSDQARPTLISNVCENNTNGGVFFYHSSSGTARANRCNRNDVGIVVDDNAKPSLVENSCEHNRRTGLVYIGHSAGLAQLNRCNNNGEVGILVIDQASPTLEQNTCQGNVVGCMVQMLSRAVVRENNNFRGNQQAGLVDERW
jgi:parallel beta-helix repeat protein